ncbi:MAG: hypothetical protein HPY53_16835 [Brevinematales bacterium]|nr:hypothetical protein [Brevinematales bacterium]
MFKYVISYDKNNKRDLGVASIKFPKTVHENMFVKFFGIADRKIDWFGSFTEGEEINGVSFFAKNIEGKPGTPGKLIKINENMVISIMRPKNWTGS